MKSKKILLNLIWVFLLALSINLAFAKEDFTALARSSIELCPCSNQAYLVTIQNTGSAESTYTVLAGEAAAEWVVFNPGKFILGPGQKGSFFVFVNSECNIEGSYNLEIFITTNSGLTKSVKQALDFSQCYDYSLEQGNILDKAEESIKFLQHEGIYSVCKNEHKAIPVRITNNEDFENRYRLFLDATDWAKLNVANVRRDAKKTGVFLINMDVPDIEGDFDFKLSAVSELGKVQRKKDITIAVEDCYALELSLEKEKDVICGGEVITYDVIVKNLGTLKQNVVLEAEGPDWAGFEKFRDIDLEPEIQIKGNSALNSSDNKTEAEVESKPVISGKENIQLNPDEEKTIKLNLEPNADVSGSFEILISATPENKTELSSSAGINVEVVEKLKCYKADISTKKSVTNYYNEDFFSARIKNRGIKKSVYDVSLEGVAWVSTEQKTIELNPGQTGNVNLNIKPSEDINPGTYGIKINLESNDAIYSEDVNVILKKESESSKKFKDIIKTAQYYIYLLALVLLLLIIFRKKIIKVKDNVKRRYEKYKVKRARLEALRTAREKRAKEKRQEKALREEKKKKPIKKEFKLPKKFKAWRYIAVLFIVAAGLFLGNYFKLFNIKYLHIYIKNFFVGYLYYILIGIGALIILALMLFFYNFIKRKKKKNKQKKALRAVSAPVKTAGKKPERKTKKRNWRKIFFSVIFSLALIGLVSAAAYLNIFDEIKDFFILYINFFIWGAVILAVLIFLIRFYKPLVKFLKE
ncbi:hypothetical protein KY347_03120 [Candidatus Woesearchaeota archaeon]|nr:hypothetical protein [Candidatus Woesearchaeota archaeon]